MNFWVKLWDKLRGKCANNFWRKSLSKLWGKLRAVRLEDV